MEIPLTSFVDYILKSGSPKLTCAKTIKKQLSEEYNPASDYYKRFREAVQELHKSGQSKKILSDYIGELPDNKSANYGLMSSGYSKFWGAKKITWFPPPRKTWQHVNIQIPVNPELGLRWEDSNYAIKMYMKADKLSRDRISNVLALMNQTINDSSNAFVCAVLDVRNGKIHTYDSKMADVLPLIKAEAESLRMLLESV